LLTDPAYKSIVVSIREWIEAVQATVRSNPRWNFLFLTKFPQRLAESPSNAWVGTTIDALARLSNAERAFANLKATVRWLSIEPMLEPLRFEHLESFNWLAIGGTSASSEIPEWHPSLEWVVDLERQARAVGAQIYHKDGRQNAAVCERCPEPGLVAVP
jgi:protein gp37